MSRDQPGDASTMRDATDRQPARNYLGAVLWMMGSLVAFTLVAIGSRFAAKSLGVIEIMFWRNITALTVLVVAVPLFTRSLKAFATDQIGRHIVRNVIHFWAQYAWLTALTLIPLAQLFALEFTAPLWVALLAPLILHEKLTPIRLLAAALGFAGAMIVIKPGSTALSEGTIAALLSALGFAISLILVKQLVRRDSATTILFYMVFLQTIPSMLLSWNKLHIPDHATLGWIAVLALSSLAAHFSLVRAFALADAIVVAPLDFLRLPLIAVVAAMAFAEPLDPLVLVGGTVIVIANLVNMWGERRPAKVGPAKVGMPRGNSKKES
jgi:drug/metabolite transporter (DMT)-like permease